MSIALFGGPSVSDLLDAQESRMRETIIQAFEQGHANVADEALAEGIASKFTLNPAIINEDGVTRSVDEAQIDPRRWASSYLVDEYTPRTVAGVRIRFYVPFTGDPQLFRYQPESFTMDFPEAEIQKNELVFIYEGPVAETDRMSDQFRRRLGTVATNAKRMEASVRQFNGSLKAKALTAIRGRREQLNQVREAGERTGFPPRER